ncbi:MAG: glycoside hydrolase family 3 C-terminal domain-containing protein, partial [Saprospiraceae bacterium]|nr:glycoside hydrolase family 3 C-terminal domain-containing protein [Saprospiraceae bacterium]
MVVGEYGYQTGEGRSRVHLDLPGLQRELIEKVLEVNKNVVLVNMSGRPLVLTWADEKIPTILQAWHLGSQSGNAIAQVLFGDCNPSGKLPMSFPRSIGQVPIYYNHKATGRPNDIGNDLVFWSHYSDESNDPLYHFGHGLSYTTFEYSDLSVDKDITTGNIHVEANVKNTGNYDGEEVIQLYVRDRVASVARPVKELKGFHKVMIPKGGTTNILFELTDKELGFYNNQGQFVVESGDFDVWISGSSEGGLKGSFIK